MGIYIILIYIKSFFFIFFLFWILFYSVGFYTRRKTKKDKMINYECGFLPFNNINVSINITFFVSACMVLIYELELLILLPAILNKEFIGNGELFLIFFFLFIIIITIIWDSKLKIIKWIY